MAPTSAAREWLTDLHSDASLLSHSTSTPILTPRATATLDTSALLMLNETSLSNPMSHGGRAQVHRKCSALTRIVTGSLPFRILELTRGGATHTQWREARGHGDADILEQRASLLSLSDHKSTWPDSAYHNLIILCNSGLNLRSVGLFSGANLGASLCSLFKKWASREVAAAAPRNRLKAWATNEKGDVTASPLFRLRSSIDARRCPFAKREEPGHRDEHKKSAHRNRLLEALDVCQRSPRKEPNGTVPYTNDRAVAFMRPCRRASTSACR